MLIICMHPQAFYYEAKKINDVLLDLDCLIHDLTQAKNIK